MVLLKGFGRNASHLPIPEQPLPGQVSNASEHSTTLISPTPPLSQLTIKSGDTSTWMGAGSTSASSSPQPKPTNKTLVSRMALESMISRDFRCVVPTVEIDIKVIAPFRGELANVEKRHRPQRKVNLIDRVL